MNLFCFTLEGSTDSLYEPAQGRQEVAPNWQCNPTHRMHNAKWGGSDPCIASDPSETHASTLKRWNRRSHVPTSSSDCTSLEMCEKSSQSSVVTKDNIMDQLNPEIKGKHSLTKDDRMDQMKPEIKEKHLLTKTAGAQAEEAEGRGTLKRLKRLVRGGHRGAERRKSASESNGHSADTVLSEDSPVMACIGLGAWPERKTQQQESNTVADGEEEGVCGPPGGHSRPWSPSEYYRPWWDSSLYSCRRPRDDHCYNYDFTPPWTTESWDRFENLVHELNTKQCEQLSPPTFRINPISDLHVSESTEKRYGSGDDPTPASGAGEKVEAQGQTVVWRRHGETLSEGKSKETERDGVDQRGVGGGEGHRRPSNSLESLSSLNSGQSSSSGVTSGSDSSSNRGSRMLAEEPPYPRQLCGRARVHTHFDPSPYDMESLTLKVGDVIDIIAKPPMGIWTGVLNDRTGTFKFIYVDVLVERPLEPRDQIRARRRSQRSQPLTLLELLEHLSLEDYASVLLQNGFRTTADLADLREQHLMELSVSDPEHRCRLLAAVGCLQHPQADGQCENETPQESKSPTESVMADWDNSPRDSGCHMSSEYSDNCREDTEIHFSSFRGPSAEMPAT